MPRSRLGGREFLFGETQLAVCCQWMWKGGVGDVLREIVQRIPEWWVS